MKAVDKLKGKLNQTDIEDSTAQVAVPEFGIPIVRVKNQPRKHKVVYYGYQVTTEDDEVPQEYRFQYTPNPDLLTELHPGVIPASFKAGVPVGDSMVFFETQQTSVGPEYMVSYTKHDPDGGDVPLWEMNLEWTDDVDALWVEALQRLEDEAGLSEADISFLDADPLWLFGVADPATQRAIERASLVPTLKCLGTRPTIAEWFVYLNADEEADQTYRWVIESFAECELPEPWTSFKGPGNVVCYLDNSTNDTTWKHPFYDYFEQLLTHCRESTHEEHIKLRINRVLWSYEAESQTDVANQMPLVSPKYVKVLGDILAIDLLIEPFMVRCLKRFLLAFSQMYHEGDLDTEEVKCCLEIVDHERRKFDTAKKIKKMKPEDHPDAALDHAQPGAMVCVQCSENASCYCPECGDCLCQECFDELHRKGNRAFHKPNHFIICNLCQIMPAMLACTYHVGKKFCVDCYTRKHAKTLPKYLDLKPLKIDYKRSVKEDEFGNMPEVKEALLIPEDKESFSKGAPLETTLGEKWHAFYDLRGVKYYYNFESQEPLRRPQDNLIAPLDEVDEETVAKRKEIVGQMAMSRAPRLMEAWTEGTEKRPLAIAW